MAEHCATTRGAGNNRAFEDAANSRISGELQEVESDLPEDIKERALSVFRASISDKCTIQQAIDKVQKEALVEVETRFKGQRFKGFIKFDYDTSVITINVNKFGNGNAQFSVGMGGKRMVCPDPFMGKLSDPNMNKR
eukprot:GFUD01112166.1.p1 GENE.GFUD01112166.1~~GFUD01112166.1.p1  ORF type:complete len:148 (-),score=58.74 GFUD01112166.1:116-526(-)